MPLRTKSQARANELLARLIVSAHHYRMLSAWVGKETRGELAVVGRERELLAQRLNEAIRRSGDLPDGLDPERVVLGDLALRARRFVKGPVGVLKRVAQREDAALLELTEETARGAPELREIAEAIHAQVAKTPARLALRSRGSP